MSCGLISVEEQLGYNPQYIELYRLHRNGDSFVYVVHKDVK